MTAKFGVKITNGSNMTKAVGQILVVFVYVSHYLLAKIHRDSCKDAAMDWKLQLWLSGLEKTEGLCIVIVKPCKIVGKYGCPSMLVYDKKIIPDTYNFHILLIFSSPDYFLRPEEFSGCAVCATTPQASIQDNQWSK